MYLFKGMGVFVFFFAQISHVNEIIWSQIKLFQFHRGGGGGGGVPVVSSEPPEPPLDPPLSSLYK